MELAKKVFGNKEIIKLCLADFAKGIFTGMIANYLIYFFQPSAQSGIMTLMTQGTVVFGVLTILGLIKAIGHIFDAFTDPLIALKSDKSRNPYGRRIPFMKWSAIPYALCALLIFCPPIKGVSILNDIWVAVFLWGYFFFYTVYQIPKGALIPELITDPKKRVYAYSISSFMFVTGSALIYATPVFVNLFIKTGVSVNSAWQLTFLMLTVIGAALLLISSFSIKERDYASSVITKNHGLKNLWSTFKNKDFLILTLSELSIMIAMSFFQATMLYYITSLLGLAESQSFIIMASSIALSLLQYPLIVKISKKYSKKILMLIGSCIFAVAFIIIFFADLIPFAPIVKGIIFAAFVSFPFAVTNILPSTMLSDVIQCDTLRTGVNKEGAFSAARSFVSKIGQSVAIMIVPSVLAIGKTAGQNVGILGIKITALIAAAFAVLAVVAILFYKNKKVMRYIEDNRGKPRVEEDAEPKENTLSVGSVAKELSRAVTYKTVARDNGENNADFAAFHQFLAETYPQLKQSSEVKYFDNTVLFKISGGKGQKSNLLMAHHDVVKAVGDWKKPPFSGEIAGDKVWGRGTVDTKGSLICILHTVEELLKKGFVPQGDLYLLSTANEETGGADARQVREYFIEKNIRFGLSLDEGGAVMTDPIAGVKGDFAMIALSERGCIRFKAKTSGQEAVKRMGGFMAALPAQRLTKAEFSPEVLKMFETLTPHMKGGMKVMFKNLKVFAPLIKSVLPKMSGEAKAMLMPTVSIGALTDSERESDAMDETGIAVSLYFTADADLNHALQSLEMLAFRYDICLTQLSKREAPAAEKYGSEAYNLVAETVIETLEGVLPCPFILFGGTDARHFTDLSDGTVRFAPLRLNKQQFSSFHRKDENISLTALDDACTFYRSLIQKL